MFRQRDDKGLVVKIRRHQRDLDGPFGGLARGIGPIHARNRMVIVPGHVVLVLDFLRVNRWQRLGGRRPGAQAAKKPANNSARGGGGHFGTNDFLHNTFHGRTVWVAVAVLVGSLSDCAVKVTFAGAGGRRRARHINRHGRDRRQTSPCKARSAIAPTSPGPPRKPTAGKYHCPNTRWRPADATTRPCCAAVPVLVTLKTTLADIPAMLWSAGAATVTPRCCGPAPSSERTPMV